MNDKVVEFMEFINQKVTACQHQEQSLIAENRKDEANLYRVKCNIYDIFRTLLQVSATQEQQSIESLYASFEKKAEMVPANWRISYEKAKEHNDVAKILIEEAKLSAANEVMAYYKTWKEA